MFGHAEPTREEGMACEATGATASNAVGGKEEGHPHGHLSLYKSYSIIADF
jgi:hypothetical protein